DVSRRSRDMSSASGDVRRESTALAAGGERLVELHADLRKIGPALDGKPGIGPRAETTLQGSRVLETHLPQPRRHPGARRVVGVAAVGDDRPTRVQLEPADAAFQFLRSQPHRVLDLEGQRLVGFGLPRVEDDRLLALLHEANDLSRADPVTVLLPPKVV